MIIPTEKWFANGKLRNNYRKILSGYENHQNWGGLKECNLLLVWALENFDYSKNDQGIISLESLLKIAKAHLYSTSWFHLAFLLKSGQNWVICRLASYSMRLLSKYLKSHFIRIGRELGDQLVPPSISSLF